MNMPIPTAITLEPQDPAHAAGLYDALRDPRIYAFLDEEPPISIQALRDRLVRLSKGAPVDTGQTWLNWTVFEGDIVVGYTQATMDANGIASLAYVLTPRVWGRSVAHAACVLTIAELEAHPLVLEIVADTDAENTRSKTLLQRLDFQQTHQVGQDIFYKQTRSLRTRRLLYLNK